MKITAAAVISLAADVTKITTTARKFAPAVTTTVTDTITDTITATAGRAPADILTATKATAVASVVRRKGTSI